MMVVLQTFFSYENLVPPILTLAPYDCIIAQLEVAIVTLSTLNYTHGLMYLLL